MCVVRAADDVLDARAVRLLHEVDAPALGLADLLGAQQRLVADVAADLERALGTEAAASHDPVHASLDVGVRHACVLLYVDRAVRRP